MPFHTSSVSRLVLTTQTVGRNNGGRDLSKIGKISMDEQWTVVNGQLVEVKILPPGKAYGADDLRNWSSRRLAGRSGVFDGKKAKKQRKRAKKLSTKPFV